MNRDRTRLLVRPLSGVLALAGLLLAPEARADCGDYVSVGGRPPAVPVADDPRPAAPPVCHGPHCSRRESPPPAAPVAPVPVPADDWVFAAGGVAAPPAGTGWSHPAGAADRP